MRRTRTRRRPAPLLPGRRTDRLEDLVAWALTSLGLFALLGSVLLGCAAYDAALGRDAPASPVRAVLLADAPRAPAADQRVPIAAAAARVTWTAADGVVHVVDVRVPPALRAGSVVTGVAGPRRAGRRGPGGAVGRGGGLRGQRRTGGRRAVVGGAEPGVVDGVPVDRGAQRRGVGPGMGPGRAAVEAFGPLALAPSDRLATMGYDVRAIRAHFPALAAGAAHFDGPGGSQVPDTVAAAVADTLLSPLANRGSVTAAERAADAVVLAARAAMGDLLGVDPRGVVFGRSMTALSFDLARTLAATWGPGDEVIVTRLDHDANIRPWMRAAESGRRRRAVRRLRPAHGRAHRGRRGARAVVAHPRRRGHRRVEPARAPARPSR